MVKQCSFEGTCFPTRETLISSTDERVLTQEAPQLVTLGVRSSVDRSTYPGTTVDYAIRVCLQTGQRRDGGHVVRSTFSEGKRDTLRCFQRNTLGRSF